MRHLQLGQGRDLYWSYHAHVPTPSQYINMIDGSTYSTSISMHQLTDHIIETGGLFRLISRLMRSEATMNRYFNTHHTKVVTYADMFQRP